MTLICDDPGNVFGRRHIESWVPGARADGRVHGEVVQVGDDLRRQPLRALFELALREREEHDDRRASREVKALADLNGKPMIQWVCEGAARCQLIDQVIVATDDARIFDAVSAPRASDSSRF